MDRNEQERLASEYGAEFSFAEERKKSERIDRLTFELDRDEADPGIGRDRSTIFRELHATLGLHETEDRGRIIPTTASEYDAMPDDVLRDMGMYRCNCGLAFYPPGGRVRHCAQDT